MENVRPAPKKTGIQHLIAAGSYPAGGARRLSEEAAFRHEVLFFGLLVCGFIAVGASIHQFAILAILFLAMIGFEALNTAIEEVVDRVSPEISDLGRKAKDLGSFACLCMIVANSAFASCVMFEHLIGW